MFPHLQNLSPAFQILFRCTYILEINSNSPPLKEGGRDQQCHLWRNGKVEYKKRSNVKVKEKHRKGNRKRKASERSDQEGS
jgi:hypothetical protein